MEKEVCLITGANSGIGKAAAIQIAQKGFRVIIGCRNKERGTTALVEIQEKSNNKDVELLMIDMVSQKSIKHAADTLRARNMKLDILIHTAADFDISRKVPLYSKDNVETVWATNHIGPVLFTSLLIDRIKQSEQGRIITIASKGLTIHPFLRININDPEFRDSRFSVARAYYQSKLAQIMYTYWLAEELKNSNITVNCIRVTNVKIDIQRYPYVSKIMKFMYDIKSKFSISPEQMARTYTYLATSQEISSISGKCFDEKNKIVTSSGYSKNKNNINTLMNITMKYLK
ncbi:MAG: SDR family NAD(P)-dependent oxidoreductase [Spirochaetota bacterium]|nr:MAG: SDR family NAD(P)-dependent oxidoreductase [Spirochaetota bacterium]